MKKDYFLSSKIALALNVVLSVAGFVVFGIDVSGLGLLLGAALATGLCASPEKAFKICLPVQLFLLAALALGAGVWFVYAVFFLAFPMLLCLLKDADRVSVLVSYLLGVFLPLIGIAAALGTEKLIAVF